MDAAVPQPQRSVPIWLSVIIWLAAFFSPTGYFLLLLLANRFQIQGPPQIVVWSLFFLIPVVALLICESMVWLHSKTTARRISWMLLTLLAMLLQFGVLMAILRAILIAVTGYGQ